MLEILSYDFFQNALIAAILISIACGIVGSLIMINRLFSMAGGITHAAFGGLGIAFYFAVPILLSVSIFTLFAAFFLAFLVRKSPDNADSFIGVIWAFGMALGLVFMDMSESYQGDVMAYLFGSVLSVSRGDLLLMLGADVLFIVLITLFYKQFLAISFDAEFASLRGIKVSAFYYLLITLIALCVVICAQLIGLILLIALLSIPCYIAQSYTKGLGEMMILSIFLSAIFCILGLFLSYALNLSSSASIILIACLGFGLNFAVQKFGKFH